MTENEERETQETGEKELKVSVPFGTRDPNCDACDHRAATESSLCRQEREPETRHLRLRRGCFTQRFDPLASSPFLLPRHSNAIKFMEFQWKLSGS